MDAATGAEEGRLEGKEVGGNPATKATAGPVAVDPAGNAFVRRNNLDFVDDLGVAQLAEPILQFNPAGGQISEFGTPEPTITGLAASAAGTLYAASADSFIRIYGPPPLDFEGPPPVPPEVSAQFATSVQRDGATVVAEVNPHFFTDATYYVQYGTGECSEGGCPSETSPASLTTKPFGSPLRSAGVFLDGLTPGATYHYRFVAESGGGGPVFGIDPDGPEGPGEASEEEGLEASFTTPDPLPQRPCPNDAFRGGPAARLPDCRAYEMVSPVDKNNGDIKTLVDIIGYTTKLGQSSTTATRPPTPPTAASATPKAPPT